MNAASSELTRRTCQCADARARCGTGAGGSCRTGYARQNSHGSARQLVSYSIYGATLVLLYSASTAYHGARRPRAKHLLRTLDHIAIYLLIAGTYTPFALISLRGTWGWSLLAIIWALAASGVVFKCFFIGRFPARRSSFISEWAGWLSSRYASSLCICLPPDWFCCSLVDCAIRWE